MSIFHTFTICTVASEAHGYAAAAAGDSGRFLPAAVTSIKAGRVKRAEDCAAQQLITARPPRQMPLPCPRAAGARSARREHSAVDRIYR